MWFFKCGLFGCKKEVFIERVKPIRAIPLCCVDGNDYCVCWGWWRVLVSIIVDVKDRKKTSEKVMIVSKEKKEK